MDVFVLIFMRTLSDMVDAGQTPRLPPGSAPPPAGGLMGKSEGGAMGGVLQLGETVLMVYALHTFGWDRAELRRSRPRQNVCLRLGACCGGVAEWLKAHSAPAARVPSLKTACASAHAAEGWPSG
jgi:hypothetical protein